MHSHDDVIYMQSKFVSNGHHIFVTKTVLRAECGHKSAYPEKRDMKRTPHRAGVAFLEGAECGSTLLYAGSYLQARTHYLLSLHNTPTARLLKVKSIEVMVMCS